MSAAEFLVLLDHVLRIASSVRAPCRSAASCPTTIGAPTVTIPWRRRSPRPFWGSRGRHDMPWPPPTTRSEGNRGEAGLAACCSGSLRTCGPARDLPNRMHLCVDRATGCTPYAWMRCWGDETPSYLGVYPGRSRAFYAVGKRRVVREDGGKLSS